MNSNMKFNQTELTNFFEKHFNVTPPLHELDVSAINRLLDEAGSKQLSKDTLTYYPSIEDYILETIINNEQNGKQFAKRVGEFTRFNGTYLNIKDLIFENDSYHALSDDSYIVYKGLTNEFSKKELHRLKLLFKKFGDNHYTPMIGYKELFKKFDTSGCIMHDEVICFESFNLFKSDNKYILKYYNDENEITTYKYKDFKGLEQKANAFLNQYIQRYKVNF